MKKKINKSKRNHNIINVLLTENYTITYDLICYF